MIYYDTNQWHWVRDAAAYHQVCYTIMLRACWRDTAGVFRVDSRFAEDRRRFKDLAALGHYQRVWDGRSPEWQADFYADTTDPLPANEWPMVDIETGCQSQRTSCSGGWTATSPASSAVPQSMHRWRCGTCR